ncbi:hypothetical protein IF2G_04599 [Cordyceps javanica]|nr:hypothetical protein IF2G_04599 [Cordyceps javanica]
MRRTMDIFNEGHIFAVYTEEETTNQLNPVTESYWTNHGSTQLTDPSLNLV